MFRQLALVYAQNHPEMKTGHTCGEDFPNGITNGAHWYEVGSVIGQQLSINNQHAYFNQQKLINISIFLGLARWWNARFQLCAYKLF